MNRWLLNKKKKKNAEIKDLNEIEAAKTGLCMLHSELEASLTLNWYCV